MKKMELTRKQVIENLQDLKETGVFPYTKKDGSVVTEEYIDYAISSLKTDEAYQLMYEGGEIFTKDDIVNMLKEIQSKIEKTVKEEELIDKKWAKGLKYSENIIQQKIDALKGGQNGKTDDKTNICAYEEYENLAIAAYKLSDVLEEDKPDVKEAVKEYTRALELLIAKTTKPGILSYNYLNRRVKGE